MKTQPLIICQHCKERRQPASYRAIFCRPCLDALKAEMDTPKPQQAVPAGFRRKDGVMP